MDYLWLKSSFYSLYISLGLKELMLLNCGVGEDSWSLGESLGLQGDPTSLS